MTLDSRVLRLHGNSRGDEILLRLRRLVRRVGLLRVSLRRVGLLRPATEHREAVRVDVVGDLRHVKNAPGRQVKNAAARLAGLSTVTRAAWFSLSSLLRTTPPMVLAPKPRRIQPYTASTNLGLITPMLLLLILLCSGCYLWRVH